MGLISLATGFTLLNNIIHHVPCFPIQSNIVESIIGDAIESIKEVNIKYIYIYQK